MTKRTILVIDDNTAFHQRIGKAFRQKYYLLKAMTAFEAQSLLEENRDVDLILLDINLNNSSPTYEGLVLLLKLKGDYSIPIIIVTGLAEFEGTINIEKVILQLGAWGFLQKKSFNLKAWENKIALAIEGRSRINSKIKNILFLASNPENTNLLLLGREIQEIDRATSWDQRNRHKLDISYALNLIPRFAIKAKELKSYFSVYQPTIVHFSGHGSMYGHLAFHDDNDKMQLIHPEFIANVFKEIKGIECVILNACYSEKQARAIAESIPFVIGMNDAISDRAGAIPFSYGFYEEYCQRGNLKTAFFYACNSIGLNGHPGEVYKPVIFVHGKKENYQSIKRDITPPDEQ